MKRIFFTFILVLFFSSINRAQHDVSSFQTEQFWRLSGRNAISWDLTTETKLPHADNIEMSGLKVAVIVTYEVDENRNLTVSRDVIFPQLRHYIESSANSWRYYRAYLRDDYSDDFIPPIIVADRTFEPGPLDSIRIDGELTFYHSEAQGLKVTRTLIPDTHELQTPPSTR